MTEDVKLLNFWNGSIPGVYSKRTWSLDLRIHSKYTRLRFKHLRLVELLSRMGNVGQAAEELGVTQSAATKILQDVEQIFGAEIFHRSARGLAATPAGYAVIEYASRFINDTTRVANDVETMTRGGAGSISIGSIMGAMPHILPPAIAELRRRKPLLTIHLTATTSDEILLLLQQRRLDIGVCRLTHPNQQASFHFENLFVERLSIFIAASHPLSGAGEASLPDLIDLPWVIQPWSSPSRQVLESALARAGLRTPRSRVETTSRLGALYLVTYGGMVGMLPNTLLADSVREGRVVALNIDLPDEMPGFGLVTSREEPTTEHAREFASIVREIGRNSGV